MDPIQSINRDRIAWCCADLGITPDKLASEVGIAATSMDRVMEGHGSLTFNQLRSVAEHLGRGLLFFLEDGPADAALVHTPQFRTLANQKPDLSPKVKTLIERVEKQRAVYLSLSEDLEDADRPTFNPPDVKDQSPRDAARIVREWLGLRAENSFDAYRTAVEARGLLVFRSNGYSGKWQIAKDSPVLGFAIYDATCPVIVVKKQASQSRETFTLMHELGHLVLEKTSSIDDSDDLRSGQGQESSANAFAGHLLVPDDALAGVRDAERPADVSQYGTWLLQQRKAWGVSTEVVLRRLLDAGRLPKNKYSAYRVWREQRVAAPEGRGNRQYRHREPMHIFGETFVRTVLDALGARLITLSRASTYLDGLKIKDLHQLETYCAGL